MCEPIPIPFTVTTTFTWRVSLTFKSWRWSPDKVPEDGATAWTHAFVLYQPIDFPILSTLPGKR
jgi:hypothetical protein